VSSINAEAGNKLKLASGLDFPCFFPGPMEGVMTPLFCKAFHELGLTDGWLTAYYRITTSVPRDSKLKKFLSPYIENGLPVIAQLMGTDGPLMAKVARRMADLGAAGINLNFACPSRQVIKSGTGGALLQDIPAMLKIINSIKDILPNTSLSVKIRCGFDNCNEIEKIIPALNSTDAIDFLGVHFRTVKEMYSEIPGGHERLKRVVELAGKVPVIGSGDVFSRPDIKKHLSNGCVGVMVARGILRDPFLIKKLQHSTCQEISVENGRQAFFKTLQNIAMLDEKWCKRKKFLEYAAMMWGTDSDQFVCLKGLSDKQLLEFEF
jgi:tRNA-dihydrouridine synthase C